MPRAGLKIVSEANLGRIANNRSSSGVEKYKEVLVCVDSSITTPTADYILSDTTNRSTMHESVYGGQRTFVNLDNKSWQGGVTTVLTPGDPLTQPTDVFVTEFPAVNPVPSPGSAESAGRGGSRGGGRRPAIKVEEELSPEEEERRRIRRERNKQAAARCRKRRVDQTMSLQVTIHFNIITDIGTVAKKNTLKTY
jgi:hypothetical protein